MTGKITVQTEDTAEVQPCPGCDRRLVMDVQGASWLLCLNESCIVTFYDRGTGRILPVAEWPIR